MSSNNTEWKHFDENDMPRACKAIIIIIIVLIFVGCIIGLIVWDGSNSSNKDVKTIDDFTFSQRVSSQPNQPSEDTLKVNNGTVVGGARQVVLVPPVDSSSQVVINRGELYYEYGGTGANGFEVRWLDFITEDKPVVSPINLSDVNSFDVDVKRLDFASGDTFTLQMNILDEDGVESSVVEIVDSPKKVQFLKENFLVSTTGERPDFSKITGIWLGGDFRASSGKITLSALKLDKKMNL